MDQRSLGVSFVLASTFGFGTLYSLSKMAGNAGFSVTTANFYRFILAAVIIWALLLSWWLYARVSGENRTDQFGLERLLLSPRKALAAVRLGAGGFAGMSGLFYLGVQYMPAGVAAILFFTYPLMVFGLSAVFLDETLSRRLFLAAVLTLSGVGIVFQTDGGRIALQGVLLVQASAFVYALYVTGSRAALQSVDERILSGYVILAAAAMYSLIGILTGSLTRVVSLEGWSILLGLAVLATVFPLVAFYTGLKRMDASRAGLVATFEPVVAALIGAVLLQETVTPAMAVGGLLVLSGVVIIQTEDRSTAQTPSRTAKGESESQS